MLKSNAIATVLSAIITLSLAAAAPLTAYAATTTVVYDGADYTITETPINGEYNYMSPIGNGLFLVGKKAEPNDLCGIIDITGKIIVPVSGDFIRVFENGYYGVEKGFFTSDGQAASQYALYSPVGKEILPLGSLNATKIVDDKYFEVYDGNLYGLIDFSGKVVIPVAFNGVAQLPMTDGNFIVHIPTGARSVQTGEYIPGYFEGTLGNEDYRTLSNKGKAAIKAGYDLARYKNGAVLTETGTTMKVSVMKVFSAQGEILPTFYGYTFCEGETESGYYRVHDKLSDPIVLIDANGTVVSQFDEKPRGYNPMPELPDLFEVQAAESSDGTPKHLINENGKVVVPTYDFLEYLGGGYFKTCIDWFGYGYAEQKWGVYNRNGEIIANKYNEIKYLGDNLFAVGMYDVQNNGKSDFRWGVVNSNGKIIIQVSYGSVEYSAGDKVLLARSLPTQNEFYEFYDVNGKLLCKGNGYAANFSNGLAYVGNKDRWGAAKYIDKSGNTVLELAENDAYYAGDFYNGIAPARQFIDSDIEAERVYGYGFIDKNGTYIVPARYDQVGLYSYSNGDFYGIGWSRQIANPFADDTCVARKGATWYVLTLKSASAPSSWASAAVTKATANGLVTDEMNKAYQTPTTRAEFCRLAVNFLRQYGYNVDGVTPKLFADTSDKDIGIAAALGITSGTDTAKNLFSPNQQLTREQAATMLKNVLTVLGKDTSAPAVAWTDKDSIASWAQSAADLMYSSKVMGGTSTTALVFDPKSPYTHEQAIITIQNLWEYAGK